jgi:hypothetical protein
MRRTKQRGLMAVRGLMEESIGIDWRIALARKTILESLRNCNSKHLGKKVRAVYWAVNTWLSVNPSFTFPSCKTLSELYFLLNINIFFL